MGWDPVRIAADAQGFAYAIFERSGLCKLRAEKPRAREGGLPLGSVQRYRGVTARRADLEGRQPDGERPFFGEDRSAPLGHLRTFVKVL